MMPHKRIPGSIQHKGTKSTKIHEFGTFFQTVKCALGTRLVYYGFELKP